LEVFNITNHFLEENGINWENCTGLCTDRTQSMSGRNTGHQVLIKKKDHRSISTLESEDMNEELQTVFEAFIRVEPI